MKKLVYLLAIILLASCSSTRVSHKQFERKRTLMLLDVRELPRNKKLQDPHYMRKVRKSQRQYRKNRFK